MKRKVSICCDEQPQPTYFVRKTSICCDEPPQPTYLAPQNFGGYPSEPPPNYQQPQTYVIQTPGGPTMQNPYIISSTIPAQAGQTTFIATTTTTENNNPQQPQTNTTKFYKVAWLSQQQRNKPQSKSLSAGKLYLFYGNFFFKHGSLSRAFWSQVKSPSFWVFSLTEGVFKFIFQFSYLCN